MARTQHPWCSPDRFGMSGSQISTIKCQVLSIVPARNSFTGGVQAVFSRHVSKVSTLQEAYLLFVCLGLFFGTKSEGMQLQASIVHVTAVCPDIKGTFSVQMILTNQDVVITSLYTQHMVYISPSLFPATVHRPLRQFSPETLTLPLSDQLVSPATNLSFGESPWKIEVFI